MTPSAFRLTPGKRVGIVEIVELTRSEMRCFVRRVTKNRKPTLHGAPADLPPDASLEDVRLEFGRRLQAALINIGWNQSDLARQASLHLPDKKPMGRDLISHYINGRTLPSALKIDAICKALHVEKHDLLPGRAYPAVDSNSPRVTVRNAEDGKAWVDIKGRYDWDIALKMLALAKEKLA